METKLTKGQSQHLIDLGVPEKMASSELVENLEQAYDDKPRPKIFTLTDLLEILPKEIMLDKEHGLDFGWDFYSTEWFAQYCDEDCFCAYEEAQYYAEELIDALYKLTVWCIENSHLNFE